MSKIRVATLGLVAAAVMLAWALPATAQHSRAAVTSNVTVIAGKPSEFHFTLAPTTARPEANVAADWSVRAGKGMLAHRIPRAGCASSAPATAHATRTAHRCAASALRWAVPAEAWTRKAR